MITHKEFADKIDGREYGQEITKEEIQEAKENGLIVVFGASDDLIVFEGVIEDEGDCWRGGIFSIVKPKKGLIEVQVAQSEKDKNQIEAVWEDKDAGACWSYKTKIPHSTFKVLEGGVFNYCVGIVFSINDLK